MFRSFAFLSVPALVADAARVRTRRKVAGTDCFSPYDGKPIMTLKACDAAELQEMLSAVSQCTLLSDDLVMPSGGGCAENVAVCDMHASDALLVQFPGKVKLADTDAGTYFRRTSGPAQSYTAVEGMELSDDFYSDWRDYDARMARIDAAVAASGGAAKIESMGKSVEGREMKIVRFTGKGYVPGNPKVAMTFNIHAREWIAGMAGIYAVEKLVEKVVNNPGYLDGVEVVMMPMANPDGFVNTQGFSRFHRKNMNKNSSLCTGVDLNRNFAFQWGTVGSSGIPCMDNYHGSAAVSEPETKAMTKMMDESPMTVYLDVHAFTQLILSAWGYTKDDHPRKAEFKALGVKMQDAIQSKHGAEYTEGPGAQVLYAVGGDTADYATSKGALGYCFELRPKSQLWSLAGFAPPKSMIQPTVEECFEGILVAIGHAKAQA